MYSASTLVGRFLFASGIAALALVGCEEKSGGETGGEASGVTQPSDKSTGAGSGTASAPASDGKVATVGKVDESLMAEFKKVVEACTVDPKVATVTKCKDNEAGAFGDSFRERDRAAALDTFSAAYISDDEEVKTVAASVSERALGHFSDDAKISVDAAKRHMAAVESLDNYQASQAIEPAVHAAMIAGTQEELFALLDGHAFKQLKAIGYKQTMTRGRLKPLPRLKELAKSDDDKAAAAALGAPRRMYKATEAEKAAVCPWIVEHLKTAEGVPLREAGHSAVWCGGEAINSLLEVGEKRLAENKFDRDTYLVYRGICFTPMGNEVPGKAQQCERNYKFLENAVKNDKLEARARGLALFAIYYQRRDATTMKLMKKYRKSKVPEIKKYAEDAIKSLKKSYKLK